jgi:hypothetical protein
MGLFLLHPSPMLLLIFVLALPSVFRVWRGTWRETMPPGYYEQPLEVKLEYGAAYFGLAMFLAAMSYGVHQQLAAAGVH